MESEGQEGLEKVGLTVNQEFGMLICRRCGVATRKEHVLTHLSSKHGAERSKDWLESATEQTELQGGGDIVRRLADRGFTLTLPIEGLPTWDGWKCSTCIGVSYYTRLKSSMAQHIQKNLRGQGAVAFTAKPHAVQLVFSTWSRRYVGIVGEPRYEVGSGANGSLTDALRQELEREEQKDVMKRPPKTALHLFNAFFVRSRWDLFIEEEDLDALKALGERPQKKDLLDDLIEATVSNFNQISKRLVMGNVLVRRWMKSLGFDHALEGHVDRQRGDRQ
jgi:hypothetical protein